MNEKNSIADDLPHCHYCGRYAFEMSFEDIPVCADCIEKLTSEKIWRVIRDYFGELWVTSADLSTVDFEILNQGSFKDMWEFVQKLDSYNE